MCKKPCANADFPRTARATTPRETMSRNRSSRPSRRRCRRTPAPRPGCCWHVHPARRSPPPADASAAPCHASSLLGQLRGARGASRALIAAGARCGAGQFPACRRGTAFPPSFSGDSLLLQQHQAVWNGSGAADGGGRDGGHNADHRWMARRSRRRGTGVRSPEPDCRCKTQTHTQQAQPVLISTGGSHSPAGCGPAQ